MGKSLTGKPLAKGICQRKDESLEEAMEIFSKNATPIL